MSPTEASVPTFERNIRVEIKRFAALIKDKEKYSIAYDLLLDLNKCLTSKPLKSYLLQLVLNLALQLHKINAHQDCLLWSQAAYNMAKSIEDKKQTSISLSIITDSHLKTEAWAEVERHILLFRELDEPLKEHLFNLEMCLLMRTKKEIPSDEWERQIAGCLEHTKNIGDVKQMTRLILQHTDDMTITGCFCERLLKIAQNERRRDAFNDTDLAEIYKIVIVLSCDGGILDKLMETLGYLMDWHRKLTQEQRQALMGEFRAIIDHCEYWISKSLKESNYLSKEALEVGAQMCAALLLLYDAETEVSHVCRTLSHQAQLIVKLKGVEETKKRMTKIVSKQGFEENLLKQILMDLLLENFTFSSALRFNFFLGEKTSLKDSISFLQKIRKLRRHGVSTKTFMREREVILRIAVLKLLELESIDCENGDSNHSVKDELAKLIVETAEELCSKVDEKCPTATAIRPWLSQFLWHTSTLLQSSSTLFGLAARLEKDDFSIRQRNRALQLNAALKAGYTSSQKEKEIDEAAVEILPDDTYSAATDEDEVDNQDEMMKVCLVLKFKSHLIKNEISEELQDLVSRVIRNKDWSTLEIFSAMLFNVTDGFRGTYKKLLFKCLQFSNTIAAQEQQVRPFMRTALHLVQWFVSQVDIDGIDNLAPTIVTFAQMEQATDEIQILLLLMIEELLNFYHRLPSQPTLLPKKHLELRDQLKSIVGSLLGLAPNYNETFKFLKL